MTTEQQTALVHAAMMANHISRQLGSGEQAPSTYYELISDSIATLQREFAKYAAICREQELKR